MMASLRKQRERGSSFRLAILFMSGCAVCAHGQSSALTPESPQNPGIAQLSDGTVSGNLYHNQDLGFQYQFPKSWAVNDKKTQKETIAAAHLVWTDDTSPKRKSEGPSPCAKSLLFVTHYPEEMRTNEFNPFAALIVADPGCIPSASYPTTTKDQESIQRIASHLGLYFKTPSIRVLGRPRIRAFENSGRIILEISVTYVLTTFEPATITSQEMMTSTVVVPAGKYWVMCMFAGGDEAQLDWLRATRIFFDSPEGPPPVKGPPESH